MSFCPSPQFFACTLPASRQPPGSNYFDLDFFKVYSQVGSIFFFLPLYLLSVGSVIASYKWSFHCYVDDVQIYLPVKPTGNDAQKSLLDCLAVIKQKLAENLLHLNEGKTEWIIFGDAATSGFGSLTCWVQSNCQKHRGLFLTVVLNLI